jgi:hypothetical protein
LWQTGGHFRRNLLMNGSVALAFSRECVGEWDLRAQENYQYTSEIDSPDSD